MQRPGNTRAAWPAAVLAAAGAAAAAVVTDTLSSRPRPLDGVGVVAGANATQTTIAEAPIRHRAASAPPSEVPQCSHNVELQGRGCRACLGGPGRALDGWGHAACRLAQSRILGQHPTLGAARCTRHSVASNVPADDALMSDFTVCIVQVFGCTFELERVVLGCFDRPKPSILSDRLA